MKAPNPTSISLHYRDWPSSIGGEPMTLEQDGALIQLVFCLWSQQNNLDEASAKRVLAIRHPAVARRIKLPLLLVEAKRLVCQRAPIEKRDRISVAEKAGGRCHYCNANLPASFHVDHAIPVSRGGKNIIENYRASCPDCNSAKGTMTEAEFMAARRAS